MAGVHPGAREEGRGKKLLPGDAVGPLREDPAQLERIPVRRLSMAPHKSRQPLTRRDALCRMGNGFGMLAFASLVNESIVRAAGAFAQDGAVDARKLDHPARAKRVIFLFMNGGLSQVDSFDPKPMLDKYHGQPLPGGTVATERKTGALMRSPFTFKKYGKTGIEVSELFPHVGECADDICFIRSMYTDIPNHEPSMLMMNTGHTQVGRPSIGSWLTYGLGTDNKNLPGYVVLCPDVPTTVGPPLWNSAFLPAVHQGTFIADKVEKQTEHGARRQGLRSQDAHLLHPQRQVHADRAAPRARSARDAQPAADGARGGPRPASSRRRSQSMETAYRMQTEAPDVFDIRKESEATLKLYGAGQHRAQLPDGGAPGRARRAHGAGLLRERRSRGTRTPTSRRTARTRRTPISRSPR